MKNKEGLMSEFITNVPTYTLNTGAVMPAVGLGTFGSDKYTPEQIANAVTGAIKAGYRMLDCPVLDCAFS